MTQRDQIGRFWKVFGKKILAKEAQSSQLKTATPTFGASLEKIGQLFIPTRGQTD